VDALDLGFFFGGRLTIEKGGGEKKIKRGFQPRLRLD
jgi:hypothetical protein